MYAGSHDSYRTFAPLFDKVAEDEKSGWVEFPMGLFLLSSPVRKDEGEQILRDVEAFDGIVVLIDDKFEARYVIPEGTPYYEAINAILNGAGITKVNIENTGAVLPRALEFEAGKEKLYAINELLRHESSVLCHEYEHVNRCARQRDAPVQKGKRAQKTISYATRGKN